MHVIVQVYTFHWGDGYDCAGWRIRLRWVMDTTALGDGFDCAGWKRQFRWLNEALEVAEWSTWCCRMKYLNEAIDVAEFSTISWVSITPSAVWGHKLWPQTFSAKKICVICEICVTLYLLGLQSSSGLFLQFLDFLQWKFGGCCYLLIRKTHWQKAVSCG